MIADESPERAVGGKSRVLRLFEPRSGHALIATGDPQVRSFVTEALSRANYLVAECGCAPREILEWCGTKSPSFLIVDVTPKNSMGMDVVRELRARGTSFPVILLAAGPCEEARDLGIESLSKPFTLESLELAIDRAFTRLSLAQLSLEAQEGSPAAL